MPTKFACSNGTSYADLQSYNSTDTRFVNGPVSAKYTQATQLIPVWGSLGYEALTHDVKHGCGNYFTINNAYPDYSKGSCGRYAKRACSGTVLK
jgi:hypothetical protein